MTIWEPDMPVCWREVQGLELPKNTGGIGFRQTHSWCPGSFSERPGVGGETGPTAPGLMLGTESFEQALQLHVTDEKTAAREGQALPATPRTTPSPRGLLVGVTCLPWRSGDFN